MKLKKLAASLLAAAMLFCGTTTTAFAKKPGDSKPKDTVTVDVTKEWEGAPEGTTLPDSVTIKVANKEVTLTKNTNWTGTIQLPKNTNLEEITKDDVQENLPEGEEDKWELTNVTGQNETEEQVTLTLCNPVENNKSESSVYELDNNNFVLIKEEDDDDEDDDDDYYIWTQVELTENQEELLENCLKEMGLLTGKDIDIEYEHGDPVEIEDDEEITIKNKKLNFAKDAEWEWFRMGKLTIIQGKPASITITNTYKAPSAPEQEYVSITVNKVWKGDENYPNARPEKITVRLLADNKVVEGKTLTLSAGNNWTDKFTDLKKYKDNTTTQEKITYTVEEVEVLKGYDSEIKTVESGFTITNTYKAPVEIKQDVTFTKKFALANGVDPNHVPLTAYFSFVLKREDSSLPFAEKWMSYVDGKDKTITFKDVPVGTYILTEDIHNTRRDWTTSIPKDGVKVSVTKEGVTFGDNNASALVVTNTYTKQSTNPDTVSISVEKEWSDGNENHENDSITVIVNQKVGDEWIYAGKCAVLSKSNDWEYTFDGLFKYKADGKTEIEYIVEEEKVPDGYKAVVTGDVEKGFTITNTYTGDEEEENPVSFTKVFKLENGAKASDVAGHKFTFTLTPLIAELREAGEGNTIAPVTIEYSDKAVEVTFENVPEGIYTLEENMPEGWTNDMPEVVVSVREDGTVYFNNSTRLTVTNTYKKTDSTPIDRDDEEEEEKDESDLTVKKVDSETGKLITEKATFRIYKLSGSRKLYYTGSSWSSNVEKAKEYSTKNGKFTAYDLGAGTYYVEEVKAPSGYNLADDLKVKLTSKDKTVEFANSKAKQNPNTGALVLPLDLADAAVAAMTLGAAAWVISKSKK